MLWFPLADEYTGPAWDAAGELRVPDAPAQEVVDEFVAVIDLGGSCYRLAEKRDGPFSGLSLSWGEEFFARQDASGALTLLRVVVPRPFRHYRFNGFLGAQDFKPHCELTHVYGGGWELVANLVLTLTVPVERAAEFERHAQATGLSFNLCVTA